MKNTNQTMAILLLMAVLFAGGLSLVSMQKVMAQGISEEPEAKEGDEKDQSAQNGISQPEADEKDQSAQNGISQPKAEPEENALAK